MPRKRVKRSASQAIPAPLSLPAPDRLSRLEQEPFDMICNHVVNEEKAFQNRPICALHCASKTLYIKTSAWVCKSGFMMTEYGLEALLRIARTPQATSGIIHITLFFPDNEDFYRWTTMDELNRMVSRLNKCFTKFNNLRTIELKPMTMLNEEEPENENTWLGPADHFEWSIKSLLDVLHTSGARITELIYDEGVHAWAWDQEEDVSEDKEDEEDDECVIYHPGALSEAQMSCLHNIEKFRVVDSNVLSNGTNWRYYTKEMLEAMPQLKELTITTPDRDDWWSMQSIWWGVPSGVGNEIGERTGECPPLPCKRHKSTLPNWAQAAINFNYSWRLTSFHLNNCRVDSLELFTNLLITHSSTLRDLAITSLAVLDTSYIGSDYSRVARDAWSNLFRTIVEKTSLVKGRFGGLSYWFWAEDGPSRVALRAAMCWEPGKSSELDSSPTKFSEVAKVRGVRNALEDWKEGMVMVRIP